jgi:hypothetical protein
MSSTYSSSLRIELIGSGDQAGAWGATTDSNLSYILDTAIAGYQAVPITSTAQALTYVNGPSPTANLNQSIYAMLKFTGASAATSVYIPPSSKQYIVWNNTSYAITVYNSTVIGNTTAAGTGITLAAADKIIIWSDGTNVYDVKAQGLTGTLAIANGGTGQTTANAALNALLPAQTNNRLLKSDGTNTSFAQASLSTDVTGTLPIANGGTGSTSTTFANLTTNVTGTLPITNGGTAQTSFTASYIHYGSFSTSSNLTYDGTNFTCGGNVTAYSDERFKTNWRNLPDNFVDQLAEVKHGVYDRTDENITQVGVSAQSLQLILEHAVIENEDGKLSVAYGNAALVAAIKLAERVVALEAKLAALTKE